MSEALETLRWKKFPVLDDGHVVLVDAMGDDYAVVEAARVSYGIGTRKVSDDRTLLRFLLRHAHATPFEMCEVKLRLRIPMDAWRQYIRHRTANVNEYSTRYSEAIDSAQKTPANQWRSQSKTNKQGSGGNVDEWPESYREEEGNVYTRVPVPGYPNLQKTVIWPQLVDGRSPTPGEFLSFRETRLQEDARDVYEERIKFGVAREQARKDLPLSTYTEAYWKCDLRNIFNFLSLRMDAHAQLEIRAYANIIGEQIIAQLFPMCWEAFNDYDHRRSGLLLSRMDTEVINILVQYRPDERTNILRHGWQSSVRLANLFDSLGWGGEKCRERDECVEKMKRLGLWT